MALVELVGGRIYKQGDQGEVVKQIQLALRGIGYSLKGTGYYGPATYTAVRTFQQRTSLTADGRVGPQTSKALDAASGLAKGELSSSDLKVAAAHARIPYAERKRPLWVEAGIQLIGTKEFAGNSNNPTIIDWAKDEGGAIARDYTHDSIAWCALFQNHILTKVGQEGTETLWALDFNGVRMQSRLNRSWPGVRLAGLAVGAICPMLRNGGGHVMTVVGKDQYGNVMGLGGNQQDQVSIAPFPLSRLNEGFWWPEDVPLPDAVGIASLPLVQSDGRLSSSEA
jgi:uncharacterized protein (TIGR02594 family)